MLGIVNPSLVSVGAMKSRSRQDEILVYKYHNGLSFINSYNKHKTQKNRLKDSWGSYTATGSEITEGEQLLCNTHINQSFTYDMIISFHQPGTGR